MERMNKMIRPMKWHILNKSTGALAVDDKDRAIEFNTQEEALNFLNSIGDPEMVKEAEIKQNILYYEGGYVDYEA